MKEFRDEIYDLIIIGAGPAGLACAIYAGRAKLKMLVLEKAIPGGQLLLTEQIENYPGFSAPVNSQALAENFKRQAERFGAEFIEEEAMEITLKSQEKIVTTAEEKVYKAFSVVIATGTTYKELGVSGEEEFLGKGVSYCGTCDGPLFQGKEIVVVGGGDAALQETLFLSRFVKKITLIHRRDRFRGARLLQERIFSLTNVEIKWNSVVTQIAGKLKVEGAKIKNLKTEKDGYIPTDGVFIFVGINPQTEFLSGFLDLDEQRFIITDEFLETSVKGVFACGDVRKNNLKQVVSACAEGAQAAMSAEKYIEGLK
jgi:thioredoxin reductase (NADPH)